MTNATQRKRRSGTFDGRHELVLPGEMLDELRALAQTNERTVAGETRLAIRAHLERARAAIQNDERTAGDGASGTTPAGGVGGYDSP
jgi:hypothetical protein